MIALVVLVSGCGLFRSDRQALTDEIYVEQIDGEDAAETVSATGAPAETPVPEATITTNAPSVRQSKASVIRAIDHPSPNFDKRTLPISMIVLHYTAAPLRESLNALTNGRVKDRVSAHYVVAEDGTIYRLVDESKRAWHAGVSRWRDFTDVNSASIGIEIVNLGHDSNGKPHPYPAKQIEAVTRLCLAIQARRTIVDVVGHSDVAPMRKIDPGELFPWKTLADRGVRVRTRGYGEKAVIRAK